MRDDVNLLQFDLANYVSFGTVIKTLKPELVKQIRSISSLVTQPGMPRKAYFRKPNENDIIMGTYIKEVKYDQSNSVRLWLEETLLDGTKGSKFSLTLYSNFADEWQNSQHLKLMLKEGKILLLFQSITYQIKSSDIQFHLTSSKSSPWIKIKNYLSNGNEVTSEKYTYSLLTDAAKSLDRKSNIYAVIQSTLKIPVEISKGRGHGMFLLVDPSCYENMIKKREYRVHIFGSSVDVIPKINNGDVIRLHRVVTELRPKDGLPDFRVFRESDLVVFPWDQSENPRAANRFTFTENDLSQVKHLRAWSLERYKQPALNIIEPKIITLSEIKPDQSFSLPCRLVEFFDEGEGVALWVEDGTLCPLYTCSDSNIQPFDSQATQDICNDCPRICVRCSKQLLTDLKLEHQMLLYLKDVQPSSQNCEDSITVVQFEIKSAVEALPQNTRYHKSLMQRLNFNPTKKSDPQLEQLPDLPNEQISRDQIVIGSFIPETPLEKLLSSKQRTNDLAFEPPSRSLSENNMEISKKVTIEQKSSAVNPVNEVEAQNKVLSSKEHIPSSGESSTDRAMKEIPSDFFEITSPPAPPLIREDIEREARRLQLMVHAEVDNNVCLGATSSQVFRHTSTEFQNIASLDDVSFSQVVASTQKLAVYAEETSDDEDEISFSQEIPNAQRLFSPGTEIDSSVLHNCNSKTQRAHSRLSMSQSIRSLSPHPSFPAVNEVLEVITSCETMANHSNIEKENENQLNISIDAPLFRTRQSVDDQMTDVEVVSKEQNKPELSTINSRIKTRTFCEPRISEDVASFGDDRCEEIAFTVNAKKQVNSNASQCHTVLSSSGIKRNNAGEIDPRPIKCRRAITNLGNRSCSVMEVSDEEISQESDKASVIELDPLSQDLEKFFCDVEKSSPLVNDCTDLADAAKFEVDDCFRITARIVELLPKQSPNETKVDLKNILVAFCPECKHLWQYNHFINSVSHRISKSRNPRKMPGKNSTNGDSAWNKNAVVNYLCCEEEHTGVMLSLADSPYPNFEAFEWDDLIFKDYSYSFICPMCKLHGIPDVLCKLEPSFFFWLHLTQVTKESSNCFHVLASGVHAEYFLGTKADYVLRSSDIWKRTEERILKLLQSQKPITLSIRRRASSTYEVCLENTYVVYSSYHLPLL